MASYTFVNKTTSFQLGPTFPVEQFNVSVWTQVPILAPPEVTRLDSQGLYLDIEPKFVSSIHDPDDFPSLPIRPNNMISKTLDLIIKKQQQQQSITHPPTPKRSIDFNDEDDTLPDLPAHW